MEPVLQSRRAPASPAHCGSSGASCEERQELEILRKAENSLGAILAAMTPLFDARERLRFHYDWYRFTRGDVRQDKKANSRTQLHRCEEFTLAAEKQALFERPEVRLRAIDPNNPPSAEELSEDIDAFYCAFGSLFDAAQKVEVSEAIRTKLVDEDQGGNPEAGGTAESQARRALEKVLKGSGIVDRYKRVVEKFREIANRRRDLEQWITPQGRKRLLQKYLGGKQAKVKDLIEVLGCHPTTLYAWRNCEGKGRGDWGRIIEEMIRRDYPLTRESVEQIRARIRDFSSA